MSRQEYPADALIPATRLLHAHEYSVQHPHVWFPDVRQSGRFVPGAAQRASSTPPDEYYIVAAPKPLDNLMFSVELAGRSEWEYGDGYSRTHAHGFAIELVTHGQGELRVGRRTPIVLKPGDVFILHPGERHAYFARSHTPFRKVYVALSAATAMQRKALMLTPLAQRSHLSLPPATARQVREIIERIIGLLREGSEDAPLRASIATYELITVLLHAEQQTHGTPRLDPRVEGAMSYVINHISEPLSVTTLARVADVSPDHLNRLFVKAVGMRAHEWLINLRMRFAAELLHKTRVPVNVIAAQAGYDNAYVFTRAFKHVAGLTPTDYRMRVWRGSTPSAPVYAPEKPALRRRSKP